MADTVSVGFSGLRELGEAMRGLEAKVSKKVAFQATVKAARFVREKAKENLIRNGSVDTGALLNSIVVKRLTRTGNTADYAVTVSTASMKKYVEKSRARRHRIEGNATYENLGDFFYARFVEFGTVKTHARPFLRPALENNKDEAAKIMIEALRQGIAKATK
jgi:HK97 gp10 family phage protein